MREGKLINRNNFRALLDYNTQNSNENLIYLFEKLIFQFLCKKVSVV
jgi:hypothetical protein